MPVSRSLPPQFLLPAWNLGQLKQLRSLQLRSLHTSSDQGKCAKRRGQAEVLRKPHSNEPLINKPPIIRPARRPPEKSATAFTSLRREEPRVVLPKSIEQDAIQNALLHQDEKSASESGASAAENRRSSNWAEVFCKYQTLESSSQTRFRKVPILKIRPLESGGAGGSESVAGSGAKVPTFRIRRYGSIDPRPEPHEGAGSKSQGSYAAVKELEDKSKLHNDNTIGAPNLQRPPEQKGVWARYEVQAKHGNATTKEGFATTAPTPRVPLKPPKETIQETLTETNMEEKCNGAALSRHVPIEAPSKTTQQPARKELSLFEELFPEEARKRSKTTELPAAKQTDLPRLPPLDFNMLLESVDDHQLQSQPSAGRTLRDDSSNAFRHEQVKILVLSRASTSLSEADFRRVVPTRGEHIEGWRGPGDIMKVIPARDVATLSPKGHYFLLFPNLAYAQAYQKHVFRLHRLAKTYNSTSPNWGLSVAIGRHDSYISGEDIHGLMQDYTLSPPFVRLSLRLMDTPYRQNVRKVLDYLGYAQIVTPDDKAGRSVLFWVNGYQPSTLSVKTMLAKDGQDRGLQWGPLRGCGNIDVFNVKPGEDDDEEAEAEAAGEPDSGGWDRWQRDVELKPKRSWVQRWVISFEDEAEARRFVRVWHRMPYMFPLQTEFPSVGEENMLVHAEFLW